MHSPLGGRRSYTATATGTTRAVPGAAPNELSRQRCIAKTNSHSPRHYYKLQTHGVARCFMMHVSFSLSALAKAHFFISQHAATREQRAFSSLSAHLQKKI